MLQSKFFLEWVAIFLKKLIEYEDMGLEWKILENSISPRPITPFLDHYGIEI